MKTVLILILIFLSTYSFGQSYSTSNKKALKLFEQAYQVSNTDSYTKSIQLLKEAIALDSAFLEAYLLCSDIYQDHDSINSQIKTLEAAIRHYSSKFPKLYYTHGNACYRIGFYEKALYSYQKYLETAGEKGVFVLKTEQNIEKCNAAIQLIQNPVPFDIKNMGEAINSADDDYWPSLTVDGKTIVFTRLLGAGTQNSQVRTLAQEDFYTSQLVDNQWKKSEPIASINTPENEGAQTISPDGKWLFFTACGRKDGMGSCDIYFSRNKGGIWSEPQNVGQPVNSGAWESQPSISANGETLYFVSSRKGGKGGMDIWKCNLTGFSESGAPIWSNAMNMGDSINTPGDENSPFIHPDNQTLYFSSNTWPGLGGFDLFYFKLNDLSWSKPHNIGYPINSFKDEQGMIVDASGKNAYYSSDRPGSQRRDIYTFELFGEAQPTPVSYVKGRVTDAKSGEPLCAKVELIDLNHPATVIKTESCWEIGEFLICLPLGKEYAFTVEKEGYLFYSQNFQLKEKADYIDPFLLEIKLEKIEIGSSVVLRNVFFNTGSFELLPESVGELQRLIDLLTANKTLRIELEGHTDNIGSAEVNLNLSELRAKEVYKYLVDKGIRADRLIYKGYGYSKPISSNETPEGRALNRRTEVKIIGK